MRIAFFLAGLIFFSSILQAQNESTGIDNTPKYSNEFMNIGVSARSFAMGFTAVSFTNDVTSGYWNPAGLNDMDSDHQLALMHSSYFGGLANYDYAAFATTVDEKSKLALSAIRSRDLKIQRHYHLLVNMHFLISDIKKKHQKSHLDALHK